VQAIAQQSLPIDIAVSMTGLFVGSFLNVLALRTLSQEAFVSRSSYCSHCHHQPRLSELFPIASYLMQKGRCPHCGTRIAWHYPVVEVFTAAFFLILVRYFGVTWYAFGMMIFASTLIAVTITDFKEKLIPHEITYPSIIAGIIFSVICRQDTLGTLAGIGVSYILFDFLAFYGLKFYLRINKPELIFGESRPKALGTEAPCLRKPVRETPGGKTILSRDSITVRFKRVNERIREGIQVLANGQPVHEIEVMGGGDAVLSALIAAWLGLPRLINALLIGFLIGSFMGAIYMVADLYKQRLLKRIVRPVTIGMIAGALLMTGFLAIVSWLLRQPYQTLPWVPFMVVGCLGGTLLGVMGSGSRVSKPFPFGPALAAGAAIAIFTNPKNSMGTGGY
jgi:prepilin signal peptidase PulO-like enzyme (type II secretory pathway)